MPSESLTCNNSAANMRAATYNGDGLRTSSITNQRLGGTHEQHQLPRLGMAGLGPLPVAVVGVVRGSLAWTGLSSRY